ncbi:right-handed parallel beta-helix repeat-containing protein [Nocardiopsis sp. JB363]|uniref:right-handed parallel beta-helix repeat-containing protein n=1 Tax=Nocardiopsis sp. JB363 TaxID=1434837 RepID=UPI000979FDBB|nr:right-handed parallel beta-helix repeat-containing protein [Nocardiopsis sp. JB363]SIO90404.1 putative sporulation protein K (stage V; partial match). Contains an ATPase domain [Nocardiopsis sp. JB363]
MITVRVSKTDSAASSSLGQVLRDPRYTGSDLYLRVEPGDYVEPQAVGVLRRVVVAPTEGAGSVTVTATNETNVFNVHKGGDLELHGVSVRSSSDEYPPLYVQEGARLRAVDCVFTSPRRVTVTGAHAEVVGCRFEDSGLLWDGSEGFVRDCYFAGAVIAVQGACSPKVSGTIFTGAHDDWHTLYVAGASPEVSDCALVDGGGIYVRDRAAPEFTDVRVTGSRDWPVRVYERSRADFTRLVVESPDKAETDAFFVHGDSESTLRDCEILGSTRTGLAIEGGRLTVRGLTVDDAAADAVLIDGGEATVTDLRCDRVGKAALLVADGARVTVSGMSVAESVQEGRGAIAAVRSRFEVTDLRVSRWHGPMAIVVGGTGIFEDIVGHDVGSGIHSREDATITVRGMVLRDAREDGLNILDGTEVRLVDADLSECGEDGVYVQGGYVTVRSSTFSGSGERGVRVGEGGVAALEDTAIRDGRGDGLMVEDGGRVRLVRCTVSGNDDEGLWAAAGASVYLEDSTFSGNRGGDGERVVARSAGAAGRAGGNGDGAVRDRERSLDSLLTELNALVGQERVKREVRALVDLQRVSAKRVAAGLPALNVGRHLVLAGPPGIGKTTVARLYGQILRSLGESERGRFVEVARPDLVAEYQGGTRARVVEAVERARGGVLFVDGAHALFGESETADVHGREVIDTLVTLMEEPGEEFVLVLAGHSDRLRSLLDAAPGLRSRLARTVEFEDYSPDQLAGIFAGAATERGYALGEGVHDLLVGHFRHRVRGVAFDNGREVRRMLGGAAKAQSERIAEGGYTTVDDLTRLLTEDLEGVAAPEVADPDRRTGGQVTSLMARLDSLAGRGEVKEALARQLSSLLSSPRRGSGDTEERPSRHLVFSGRTGTGRATVAGLYGELLAALGLVARGQSVRLRADDLVERGSPSREAVEAFERARGGVLSVLLPGPGETGGAGHGRETADVLDGLMETHHDDVVVVLAGDPETVAFLLRSRPHLAERFAGLVEFAPYKTDELVGVFAAMAEEADLRLPERTREALAGLIGAPTGGFAERGGVEVRALFEECVARQARRIEAAAHRGEIPEVAELQTLLPEDLPEGGESED